MERMYCISGLGADHRVFQNVSVNGMQLVYIPWPRHDKNETIPSYARKVSALIPDDEPYIMGVSFGGMLAVEIAKMRPVKKVFIISSAKTVRELTPPKGILKFLMTSNIIPAALLTVPNKIIFRQFGARTRGEQQMLKEIFVDADARFMKWAMKALMHWQNESYTNNVVHIHGTNDKIIPSVRVKPHYWIDGGTHIMIYNRAVEINALINNLL